MDGIVDKVNKNRQNYRCKAIYALLSPFLGHFKSNIVSIKTFPKEFSDEFRDLLACDCRFSPAQSAI